MNRSNKNLYQILKIDKNTNLQEINSLVLKTSPKDDPEVGKALMVLTDPQKKLEYDKYGWKDEWEVEWEKEANFRNSIFEAIQNYKHNYGNTEDYTPDGYRVYVAISLHLDSSLWAPYNTGSGVDWVKKIWGTHGSNWKSELEDFKNKMLAALDEAWEKAKKTPLLDTWEAVESGNCAKCGKPARLRWKDRDRHKGDKVYCSRDCAMEDMKIDYELPKEFKDLVEYYCQKCHKKGKDVYKTEGGYYHKSCFDKKSEKNEKDNGFCVYCGKKNGSETWNWDNTKTGKYEKYCSYSCREKAGAEYCDYCGKQIEKRREGNKEWVGMVGVDSEGNTYTFCSEECSEKGMKKKGKWVVRKNVFKELLKWMEKEGITSFSLDPKSKKLVVEYGKNNSKTIEDDNLTSEQREIKNFLLQNGKNSLSQNEVREEVNKGKKFPTGLVIGIVAVVLIVGLIIILIYQNWPRKRKGY